MRVQVRDQIGRWTSKDWTFWVLNTKTGQSHFKVQGATHPVLAEAVTQFQALAYKELLPARTG